MLAAAARLKRERIATPVVLGAAEAVAKAATEAGIGLDDIEVPSTREPIPGLLRTARCAPARARR